MKKSQQAKKLFDSAAKSISELHEFISENGYGGTNLAQNLQCLDGAISFRAFEVNLDPGGELFIMPISDMDQYVVVREIPGCTATIVRKIQS